MRKQETPQLNVSLKNVPEQYKFEYLKSCKRLMEIRSKFIGFIPQNEEEQQWLKATLKEYHNLFKRISEINELSKKRYTYNKQ